MIEIFNSRQKTYSIIDRIKNGVKFDLDRLPSFDDCVTRLDSTDEVIAIMAAQILNQKQFQQGLELNQVLQSKVNRLLSQVIKNSWFTRANYRSK